jgi:hypothetical protein
MPAYRLTTRVQPCSSALNRAGCKTLFKDEDLSGATTKRPACVEADGLCHYKGYRLGLYLARGFLRRRATVELRLSDLCARVSYA